MMKAMPEILAPAGGPEALEAAVRSGADAVYLGGKAFNARRNAANFSEEELSAAIKYCHARGVKVYITLNTLVGDSELKTAQEEIECACRLSADALILQDTGLARLARQIAPDMPLHASTQMSVQSAEGVKLLEKAGFSRVVLSRELSRDEIAEIKAQTTAELEVFVHGALCMSVSGQCLLSAVLGSRSGNRGLCAQPCRLPFGVNGEPGHALSLKDLSLVPVLGELAEAGAASFKIEGRMKRPEYVAAAVTACRKSLNGELSGELSEKLRSVFSRSGFTRGYFEAKTGADMFGTRQKEDVESAAPVLKSLRAYYDKENPSVPVDFALTCIEGEPISLSAAANGKTVFCQSETAPEPAINRALTEQELTERISKCGGTQFFANDVFVDLDDNLSAPASVFNALRREALQKLDSALAAAPEKRFISKPLVFTAHKAEEPRFHIRVFSEKQLPDNLEAVSRVILPLNSTAAAIERVKESGAEAAVEIPRAFFSNTEHFKTLLLKAVENGAELAVAGGLDGFNLSSSLGIKTAAGFGTNIFNTGALAFFEERGCTDALLSCELTLPAIARLGGKMPRGVLAYGKLPLMLMRNCPVKSKLTCEKCKGSSHLTDRMGIDFPVQCSFGCSELLNSRPVILSDRLREIKNADYLLLRFTDETKAECEKILGAYLGGEAPEGEFTRGLIYRGVE